MEEKELEPLPVRIKYYTTLALGLVSCLSCFIFMFLIPFVLDPSISTLIANFDPEPIVCRTILTLTREGMKNCSWSSCKIGCTTDQYACDRIYVNYLTQPYAEYEKLSLKYDADDDIWTVKAVPVFINIKACGYAPEVNCTVFSDDYASVGSYFPCYYSRTDPTLVITIYSWTHAVRSLILAIIIPNVLTGASLGVLSYWWYPGCQKKSSQYEIPPDQEAAITNDDDDDDEENSEDSNSEDEKSNNTDKKAPSIIDVSVKSQEKQSVTIECEQSPISYA